MSEDLGTLNSISFTLSKESLEGMVKNFKNNKKTIPVYDSVDKSTRKKIGEVTDVWITENDRVGVKIDMTDGKKIKGIGA